jgi:hypothetical protein
MIELERLRELPLESEVDGAQYVDQLTRMFSKHPEAPRMTLRPLQAAMLVQAVRADGLVALAGCGSGKTLTSLLLPLILGAERPLLILPASMRAQNLSDQREYAEAWSLRPVEIMSYESISSPKQQAVLDEMQPDLIICDEAHYLRNLKSARVRRIEAYLLKSKARFCALSGTLVSRSLREYAHTLNWALKMWSPLPRSNALIEVWARVIEEGDAPQDQRAWVDERLPPGPSLEDRFHHRLRGSRGVVISSDERVSASLVFERRKFKLSDNLKTSISRLLATQDVVSATHEIVDEQTVDMMLRSSALWSPQDAIYSRVWAQRLMGCVYVWEWGNRAPDHEWVEARRGWGAAVRHVLDSGRYDSEALLKRDLRAGRYTSPRIVEALSRWDAVADREPPNTEVVWVDESWVRDVVAWAHAQKQPPIIWVQLRAVAEKLKELSGFASYGSGAEDAQKLNDARETAHPCIMSIAAHGTGKNLQAWENQIVAHPLSHPARWEQMVARTHRNGQTADSVRVHYYSHQLFGRALRKARNDAQYIYETTGQEQRLIYADWN